MIMLKRKPSLKDKINAPKPEVKKIKKIKKK